MRNKSTDGQRISQNFKTNWANTSAITNLSTNNWSTTSLHGHWIQDKPITSKYERILQALEKQNIANTSKVHGDDRKQNQTNTRKIEYSQKLAALILPLVLMGVFLALVVVCHRFDAIRKRKGRRKSKTKAAKTQRSSATEQAVEEVDRETDMMLQMVYRLGKPKPITIEDVGQNAILHCMCKLERCAHCLGYETKKIQWKDLVYQTDFKTMNKFELKNASTQTWMPMHNRFRAVPQSSHKDSSLSQRIAAINRNYVVEADSVFDSEVSSKPHFPSSESNYTDSRTSDFMSSIRASGSFYYSAASAQDSKGSADHREGERSNKRQEKQKGLKKQHVGEAQLLSDDEDWL